MSPCFQIDATRPSEQINASPSEQINVSRTFDSGAIRSGGACRLPVKTADNGKIRLGGACRLPLRNS
jgi:hypothetical protein